MCWQRHGDYAPKGPGEASVGLSQIARLLEERGINILDATAFLSGEKGRAVLLVETERIPEAEQVVAQAGLKTLSDEEIYSL